MNRLESDITNVQWTPNWYEDRCNRARIFESYLDKFSEVWAYEGSIKEGQVVRACFVTYSEEVYMWLDVMEDGKLEHSRFEKILNNSISKLLYTTTAESNEPTLAPMMLKAVESGMLKPIG